MARSRTPVIRTFKFDQKINTHGEVEYIFDTEAEMKAFAAVHSQDFIGRARVGGWGHDFLEDFRGEEVKSMYQAGALSWAGEKKRWILKQKKDAYIAMCPGQRRPQSTIENDPENVRKKRLVFLKEKAARFYERRLRDMHVDRGWAKFYKDNQCWVISIQDEVAERKIKLSDEVYSNLFTYDALRQLNEDCARLLVEFKQKTGWEDFLKIPQKAGTREDIKNILEDQKMSPYWRVQEIISIIKARREKITKGSKPSSSQSEVFFKGAEGFGLDQKLQVIIGEIKAAYVVEQYEEEEVKELSQTVSKVTVTETVTVTPVVQPQVLQVPVMQMPNPYASPVQVGMYAVPPVQQPMPYPYVQAYVDPNTNPFSPGFPKKQ